MNENSNKMTVFDAIVMSVGTIIGAGLFSSLPLGITMVGSNVGWALVIGAVFVAIKTLPSLYMQSALPVSAGSYVYMARFIHPSLAFIQSLNSCIGMFNIAVMTLTFANYFAQLFPNSEINVRLVAIVAAITLGTIATFGAKFTGRVQTFLVAILVAALAVYIFCGLGAVDHAEKLTDYITPSVDFLTMWGAVAILNYALQGGTIVAGAADEIENPSFAIPFSFIFGTSFVTLIYAVIGYITWAAGPVGDANGGYNLGAIAATFMSPLLVKFFIVCGALFATVTTLQGSFLMYSRLFYVSAKDGIWPKVFTLTNKYNVPWFSLWFCNICACTAIAFGIELSQVLRIVSIPGLALGLLFYYPMMVFAKKYPNAAKRAYIRLPQWLLIPICIFSVSISLYMARSLILGLEPGLAFSMFAFYFIGYGYYFIRKSYLAKKGIDIVAKGRVEPASWIERNKPFEESVAK